MIVLKLDGIDGDCQMPDWKDYITLSEVSWDISRDFSDSAKMGTKDLNVGTAVHGEPTCRVRSKTV